MSAQGAAAPARRPSTAAAVQRLARVIPFWNRLSGAGQSAILARAIHARLIRPHRRPRYRNARADVAHTIPSGAALANVEVNSPAQDRNTQQTTQSETSVSRLGNTLVVGYNDSTDFNGVTGSLTGYSVSTDGGATFTDKGSLNAGNGQLSEGDPGLAVDPAGNFYFSAITANSTGTQEYIAVSKSTDGGQTFGTAVRVTPIANGFTTFQDKEYITVGQNPSNPSQSIIYVTWTAFGLSSAKIDEVRSTDGGATWSTPVVISSGNLQGSDPVVDPRNGKLYVFFNNSSVSTMVASSTNGGVSFSAPVTVGQAPPASQTSTFCGREGLHFATGRDVRANEFPSGAVDPTTGNVYATWDGGVTTASGYISQIGVAASTDGGATWKLSLVNGKQTVQRFFPWISVNSAGVHVSYYQQIGTGNSLSYFVSTSPASVPLHFGAATQLGSTSFAVDQTNPNFDPIIATCYMGDYTNSIDLGNGKTFYVWGDNRNIDPIHGPDPDIWSAIQ